MLATFFLYYGSLIIIFWLWSYCCWEWTA